MQTGAGGLPKQHTNPNNVQPATQACLLSYIAATVTVQLYVEGRHAKEDHELKTISA